ncbi:WYL domain-containing protein [uncultured Ramlibacter sp.]|uniref:helix-turn-helix transcriptional regulator n=1 Tax=uncultured Ramlibacter sp. TaxID=260755 RepID=UPI002635CB93|nr:WYL domain-containing protein [uncultured Ramlibacter sp.]
MKLKTGVHLLRMLPTRPEGALTTAEISQRWTRNGGAPVDIRSIQRYMEQLRAKDGEGPALLGTEKRGRERAYYLLTSQVANWFMTEEAALDLQLSRDVFGRALRAGSKSNAGKLADMAEQIVAASPEAQRIRERLQIAPDGIGRLPARFETEVLRAAIDAIGKNRKLKLTYKSSQGKVAGELVSPLGLVAKDGTIYLVAVRGLTDSPRPLPLHRVSAAEVHFQQAQLRPEFELKKYILDSHQFSHPLDPKADPVVLKLRVAPETIYHFKERPLSADQKELAPKGAEPWWVVTATVPNTLLLVPFLLSMGHWIEVVEPADVRAKTAERVGEMWAHYAP